MAVPQRRGLADLFRATEIDARLVGMLGALALIWIGVDILSGGAFLTPRNLWNLSVQTASVAVMAAGMVLVIVARHIDLSVGSILGLVGMIMGVTQAEFLPKVLGFDHPLIWVIALLIGLAVGAAIGLLQGAIVAYLGVPAFIVTLGGLLVCAYDLGADPYMVYVLKAWIMAKTDGWWFGETLQGFVGWTGVAFTILFAFRLTLRARPPVTPLRFTPVHALVPLSIYGGSMLFQMAFGSPVETRTIAFFAMGIPLLVALCAYQRWQDAA